MISVYFLWFDYWTLKEWKTAKVQNNSVFAYKLFTQMVNSLFDMFAAAMFFLLLFFCQIRKYVRAYSHFHNILRLWCFNKFSFHHK